jgi:hypothetical protein
VPGTRTQADSVKLNFKNMKEKLKSLGRKLSKEEQYKIMGGVQEWPCYTYTFSGSNGSGSSMTCDYMVTDAAGNVLEPLCEVACQNGCNYEGCSYTRC